MTPNSHQYFKQVEMREEGGTPAIIGSIRAGLTMQLKEAVGCQEIMAREEQLAKMVLSRWGEVTEVCVHVCMYSACTDANLHTLHIV